MSVGDSHASRRLPRGHPARGPGLPHRGQDPARSGRRGRTRQARLPARRGIVRRPAILRRDQQGETGMNTAQSAGSVYALLADGTTVEIRPADPADFDAVRAMHEAMSPDNTYLRFFNLSRMAAETEAQRICRHSEPGRVALLALAAGEVMGCASYDTLSGPAGPGTTAEVAFAVADRMHHRGIATLLLEHLVSFA